MANSYLFSEREKAVTWTSAIMWGPANRHDTLWERLHASFSTEELVELGFLVG